MSRRSKKTFTLALAAVLLAACSGKSSPPAAQQAPSAPPIAEQPAAAVAAAAQPKAGLEGKWEGDSGQNMPLRFSVANNQVSDAYVNLKGKKGSCSVFGSLGSEGPSPIAGKSFTTHGKHDQFEFTLTGTFTSDLEASGTIDWKTNSDICGPYDTQFKWTAKKGPAETPSDDE